MRRKLFGLVGGAIALAGAVGGAFTAERKRRDARFYRDLMADLQVVVGIYRGRLETCAHEEATSEIALTMMTRTEEFDLVQGGLSVEVEVGPPDNMDVTRLSVTFYGSGHTLFMLRQRLMADTSSRLGIEEDVSTITPESNGSQLQFTVLVPDITDDMAASVQRKLE